MRNASGLPGRRVAGIAAMELSSRFGVRVGVAQRPSSLAAEMVVVPPPEGLASVTWIFPWATPSGRFVRNSCVPVAIASRALRSIRRVAVLSDPREPFRRDAGAIFGLLRDVDEVIVASVLAPLEQRHEVRRCEARPCHGDPFEALLLAARGKRVDAVVVAQGLELLGFWPFARRCVGGLGATVIVPAPLRQPRMVPPGWATLP